MAKLSKNCDAPYLRKLDCIDINSVFIMGHHRSGTTIFYKLLSETNRFNTCSLYHVIYRNRLLYLHFNSLEENTKRKLNAQLKSFRQNYRGFDTIDVSADMSEEYCYALAHQDKHPMINDKNLTSFLEFSRKLQLIQNSDKPLLHKSPFDFTNFLYIKEKLTNSKFVFIHRHPVEVINSQVKAIRSLMENKNEYVALVVARYKNLWKNPVRGWLARNLLSEHLPILVSQVISNVSRENQRLLEHIDSLPEKTHTHVTYDQLCKKPNTTIAEILDFLQIKSVQQTNALSRIQKRPLNLLPEVASRKPLIMNKNEEYCNKYVVDK